MASAGSLDEEKVKAAERAVDLARDYRVIGVGTGSTVEKWIEAIAGEPDFKDKLYVPSSIDTMLKLRRIGLNVVDIGSARGIEFYVDGADEVDRGLNMIKGGGAALLREKVLAKLSRFRVIIVDSSKLVDILGVRRPVPLEVVPAALPVVEAELERMKLRWSVRMAGPGKAGPVVTDNGNLIVDVRIEGGIRDPENTYRTLKGIVGVAEVGIFTGLADLVVVGRPSGVVELRRSEGG